MPVHLLILQPHAERVPDMASIVEDANLGFRSLLKTPSSASGAV
ncbi:MAG: hypothetical protein ACM3NP_05045 [Actinomycetota bacterium]|jgi:hypothetical protein